MHVMTFSAAGETHVSDAKHAGGGKRAYIILHGNGAGLCIEAEDDIELTAILTEAADNAKRLRDKED